MLKASLINNCNVNSCLHLCNEYAVIVIDGMIILQCVHYNMNTITFLQDLLTLEEQEGSVSFKVGVVYAQAGQTSDVEMMCNSKLVEWVIVTLS